jgi:hypothetical protein
MEPRSCLADKPDKYLGVFTHMPRWVPLLILEKPCGLRRENLYVQSPHYA